MLWQICRGDSGLHDLLLHVSVCCFAEFYTSVICYVFMHCLGPFLLQNMFISLQEFVLRDKI